MVLVGIVARPHGLGGQVIVNPETDFIEVRFAPGATFWTRSTRGDEPLVVATARVQNGRPVVGFAGCTTIDQAQQLSGLELRVSAERLQPLDAGSYYQHELVGCAVETTNGERVGEVARVEGGATGSLLAIDGPRGEILIPFAVDICVEIDMTARRIRIDPPDGLLELNEKVARSE